MVFFLWQIRILCHGCQAATAQKWEVSLLASCKHPWWGIIFRNGRRLHHYIVCQHLLCSRWFLTPSPLVLGSVLLYLQSLKVCCCSSDDLPCSCQRERSYAKQLIFSEISFVKQHSNCGWHVLNMVVYSLLLMACNSSCDATQTLLTL